MSMKNDVEVDVTPRSVSVQAAGQRHKKTLQKLEDKAAAGSTMTHKVMGKEVVFKLVEVPASKIEMSTMVWLANERAQELLDAHAVSDLLESFRDQGQQVPAFGRDVCGQIEIADGSRRRHTALETKKPFYVWVGDLSPEQMEYLSEIGNQYKETSAYEKGLRYEKLLKNATQEEVSEAVGVTRKAMMRCVQTAQLPLEFIRSFTSPNELSARKGEVLHKLYKALNEEQQLEIVNFCESWLIPEKGKHTTDELVDLFTTKCVGTKTETTKPEPKTLTGNATVMVKNGNARFDIKKVSPQSLKAIEEAITKILDQEALDNF
ncbi:ParB/RepB/Spo0J family partition protein [Vibrio aestuarianus]|uniref:ParB/RepB/Spo0J family partition protein n=1 Tax=Vibrio aestuarianus TaxID=28171 RepID=UPI00237CE1D3|nr:ParB/RepB/Spo0J family partition protein [Vibrio aestuarianus]MDE1333337.1 ParB/RepB/Spo0J family partition protein [Vibrio aestuarianus]